MFARYFSLILLLLPVWAFSQDLTGIWKGYFTTGLGEDKHYYKYELQLAKTNPSKWSGVSYSYLNTSFYGKSEVSGYYQSSGKKMDLKEIQLLAVKGADRSAICLMHCEFSYSRHGETEQLEGTFTSSNMGTGSDCGAGYIFLERASKSVFHVEPFLASRMKNKKTVKKKPASSLASAHKSLSPKNRNARKNPSLAATGKSTSPTALSLVKSQGNATVDTPESASASSSVPKESSLQRKSLTPEIFMNRKNKLVKTIITHTPEVDISFYDNGEIDDDSITVYHNLNRIIQHGRLSRQPIDYGFDASDEEPLHSFIIVADNLGKIPPNSVLMVIYTNNHRYEVFIESDLLNNGEVRILYEPVKK